MFGIIIKIKNVSLAIITYAIILGCKTTMPNFQNKTASIKTIIDLVNIIDDKVKIELLVSNIEPEIINYYFPEIIPGTYQKNNYGKFIEDFEASDIYGNLLMVKRYGDNRWEIKNANKLHKITYLVNDTFDSENTHDVFSPTGSNILENKNFVLNLYAFVGYLEGMKECENRLLIKHPKNLKASTSLVEVLPEKSIENVNYDFDLFVSERYADLVDSPIMYSEMDQATFTISDIEVLLSVYSPNNTHKAVSLIPQMERVIRAQKYFLGNISSVKKYSILLYLSTSKNNDAQGFGALEHTSSTVIVLPESLSSEKLNKTLTDVVSHEFFHIIAPLTIHSEEIHDFNYNEPKMSRHLWLYEGSTEYFSLLFQITQGLISKKEFFEQLMGKIEKSKAFDDTMSFIEMSKNILEEPYFNNYKNVYQKGALISMCLDIIIRDNSGGVFGILDVIKKLSKEFGIKKPFKDNELISIIKKISYPEVGEFLEKHVVGNIPIDYEMYFNRIGLKYTIINIESSFFLHEQNQYIKGLEKTNEVYFTSEKAYNSFLKKLGIQGGDILLSINTKEYSLKNIYDLFGDSNRWKIGDSVVFKIKRNNKIMTLKSEVIQPTVEKKILKQDSEVTQYQLKLLKTWLND